MATRSMLMNGLEHRVRIDCGDYRDIGALYGHGKFDTVTMNPPYREQGRERMSPNPVRAQARHEGAGNLRDSVLAAATAVKFGGRVALVFLAERLADLMVLLRAAKLEPKRLRAVHSSVEQHANLVMVEAAKGGGLGLRIEPPLAVYDQGRQISDEVRANLWGAGQEVVNLGTLYVVGTPIGNLEDITRRALRILAEVSVIAAEDTRQTRKLLNHYGIGTSLTSYHEHNERTAGPSLLARLMQGEDIALVTDAGMPGISDPGETLIRLAIDKGVPVVPVPGPTAFVTALVVSGLNTDRFVFEGFLPPKRKDRQMALDRLKKETRTSIFYEAPHRLLGTLREIQAVCGERPMVVARELTKVFEEVLRDTPAMLIKHFEEHAPRGEFVLVVSGVSVVPEDAGLTTPELLASQVNLLVSAGADRKEAMKEVAARYGLSKRDIYQALLSMKEEE